MARERGGSRGGNTSKLQRQKRHRSDEEVNDLISEIEAKSPQSSGDLGRVRGRVRIEDGARSTGRIGRTGKKPFVNADGTVSGESRNKKGSSPRREKANEARQICFGETEDLIEDRLCKRHGWMYDDEDDEACQRKERADHEEYEVEGFRDRKVEVGKGGKEIVKYLVKWKYFPDTKNTWETFLKYPTIRKDAELWWAKRCGRKSGEVLEEDVEDEGEGLLPTKLLLSRLVTDDMGESVRTEYKEQLLRSAVDEEGLIHEALVCVVCDRFMPCSEAPGFISMKVLQKHKERLSVASYEAHHRVTLPDDLVSFYTVPGGEGMLLSRSARNNGEKFLCCPMCRNSFAKKRLSSAPPKYAICNGFAIGKIPRSVVKEEDLTPIMSSLIAPVRPFSFVFSYFAGAQKSIRGHVTFMQNDVQHLGATLYKYTDEAFGNPLVYVVLCGRFTPKQRIIAKDHACLDTTKFFDLLRWLIEQSGNPAFKDMFLPEDCPSPKFFEDDPSPNNTDEEVDADVESRFTGSRFYFPSAFEPNESTGAFGSEESFIKAMFEGSTPTLLVHGGNYVNDRDVPITDMFPIQFPFGEGGTNVKRRNPVSVKECLRHYFCLKLDQMHRPDFVLVVTSMYNRIQAFDTGFVMCKMNLNGRSWGEDMSCLTAKEITVAAKRKDDKLHVGGVAGRFFTAITSACKPVGHTNEAAAAGRRKMFALGDMFGESSIFLSVTPDDENSFKVKLLAHTGKVRNSVRGGVKQRAILQTAPNEALLCFCC